MGITTPVNKCPHCGGDPQIPDGAKANCERYHSTPIARARCCGYGVRLVPHLRIDLEAAPRNTRIDMFGVALNRDLDV